MLAGKSLCLHLPSDCDVPCSLGCPGATGQGAGSFTFFLLLVVLLLLLFCCFPISCWGLLGNGTLLPLGQGRLWGAACSPRQLPACAKRLELPVCVVRRRAGERSVHGSSPTGRCRPWRLPLHFSNGTPRSPAKTPSTGLPSCCDETAACCARGAALCHGPLAQPFLFSRVGRSPRDLLCFPGQKAKRRDEVQPAPPTLCCFCFPPWREETPPPPGKGCSGASPFPAVLPGFGDRLRCSFLEDRRCVEKSGLVFTWGRRFTCAARDCSGNAGAAWEGVVAPAPGLGQGSCWGRPGDCLDQPLC